MSHFKGRTLTKRNYLILNWNWWRLQYLLTTWSCFIICSGLLFLTSYLYLLSVSSQPLLRSLRQKNQDVDLCVPGLDLICWFVAILRFHWVNIVTELLNLGSYQLSQRVLINVIKRGNNPYSLVLEKKITLKDESFMKSNKL